MTSHRHSSSSVESMITRITDTPWCDACGLSIAVAVTRSGAWLCTDCQRLLDRLRLCVPGDGR